MLYHFISISRYDNYIRNAIKYLSLLVVEINYNIKFLDKNTSGRYDAVIAYN